MRDHTPEVRQDTLLLLGGLVAAWIVGVAMTVAWGVEHIPRVLELRVHEALHEGGLPRVRATVEGRAVHLEGAVATADALAHAAALARAVPGASQVALERLFVAPPPPASRPRWVGGAEVVLAPSERAQALFHAMQRIHDRFETRIPFPNQSARLSGHARASLDEVASLLAQYPKLHGAVCSEHGELSVARALAVHEYLLRQGVPKRQIGLASPGSLEPGSPREVGLRFVRRGLHAEATHAHP